MLLMSGNIHVLYGFDTREFFPRHTPFSRRNKHHLNSTFVHLFAEED